MEALLTSETLPVTLPVAVGAKSTLKEVLLSTPRVRGSESPLTLNSDPVTLAAEIVRLAEPVFFKTTGRALVVPTVTFPKLTLAGVTERNPTPGTVPFPESPIAVGELEAVLTSEMLPVTLPVVLGVKLAVNEVV